MIYDVIILGAGPAGLSAGLYAGRARLQTLILEKGQDGGQIANTADIENYPGQLSDGESGVSLVARMSAQAEAFGCQRTMANVREVHLEGDIKVLQTRRQSYKARTVIIATGASPRPIGCKGEAEFLGRGVSYCATCDGNFYKGKEVFVVGGGDAALEEAIYLTRFARKVTLVHRRDTFRGAKSIQERVLANEKIVPVMDSIIESLEGEGLLTRITLRNVKTGTLTHYDADPSDRLLGVFGFTGTVPATALFEGILDMENGYIITDENMKTSLPGVFAAGDVRVKSLRQVVTAVADGAIAAVQAGHYLEGGG